MVSLFIAFVCVDFIAIIKSHLCFCLSIDYIASPPPRTTNPIKTNFDPSHLYAQPSKSNVRIHQPLPSSSSSPPLASISQPPSKFVRPIAEPSTSSAAASKFTNPHLPKTSLGEKFKNSAHSSSQESNNSHSDHSGASGVTLPLDDEPIEYADA